MSDNEPVPGTIGTKGCRVLSVGPKTHHKRDDGTDAPGYYYQLTTQCRRNWRRSNCEQAPIAGELCPCNHYLKGADKYGAPIR